MKRVYAYTPGCPKARCDTEAVLADLLIHEYEYVGAPEYADLIIVNTCGFIKAARDETCSQIKELKQTNPDARLIAIGCMVEKFQDEITKCGAQPLIGAKQVLLTASKLGVKPSDFPADPSVRLVTTPFPYAYLKIAEGCNRRCAFCIIPQLRGKQVSRPVKDLVEEASRLTNMGYHEIILVAQDVTSYGRDINTNIEALLSELVKIPELYWLRLMYLYPSDISDNLIEFIKNHPRVLPYFDIPFQHVSPSVLKSMKRGSTARYIDNLLPSIKTIVPEAVIRTTLLIGFPGEQDEDVETVLSWINSQPIDFGGVFAFSDERLAPSYHLKPKIHQDVINNRVEKVMRALQAQNIKRLKRFIGQRHLAAIEEKIGKKWYGRLWFQAPEIDGYVVVTGAKSTGFWEVEVTKVRGYVFYARAIRPWQGP